MSAKVLRVAACLATAALVMSCGEDELPQLVQDPPQPRTETRRIADISFIKNTYFFFDDPSGPFYRPDPATIEVWQSLPDGVVGTEVNTKRGRAWLDTSGRGDDIRQGLIDLENGQDPPFVGPLNFELLTFLEDFRYLLDDVTDDVIGIELIGAVAENKVLAVRYINEWGDTIGDIGTDSDPINLELIKNANQKPDDPDFGPAWRYMMRHIYDLGLQNIDAGTVWVQILENTVRADPHRPDSSAVPWLRIFGLDQTDETGLGPPDDRIDLGLGLIDLRRGLLTFPILRAFDPSDQDVALWTDGEFSFESPTYEGLRNPALYDEFLVIPQDAQKFTIEVIAVID